MLSIIMPTYNRAYVLWNAIESVMSQIESRWEVIVVNNGSTIALCDCLRNFRMSESVVSLLRIKARVRFKFD